MDWRPFASLEHPGYDIMVVWDYRQLTFSWRPVLNNYEEICLIAWSMGVFAASITIHEIAPRITMRIAVNGTLDPIDERRGIPPAIWRGTLNALSPATWRKFQRRMCTTPAQFADFQTRAPRRTIADLSEELIALETHSMFHTEQITDWDMAVVGREDGIFPPENQNRAWRDIAPIRILDSGHLPDFAQIIRRLIIDKTLVSQRFGATNGSYTASASVQHRIAHELMRRFDLIFGNNPIVGNVIEAGPGHGGTLTRLWVNRTDPRAKLRLWDITDIDTSEFAPTADFEKCDAEVRIKRQPSNSAGFIFSSSTIQWFNSPREFIRECERVLVPGGYLVFSSFVQGNLEELNRIIGNGLQLPSYRGWQNMVADRLTLLTCEPAMIRLNFDTPRAVLEHLRATGVNAVMYGESPTITARRVLRQYRPDEDGRYPLTYRPVYIVARKEQPAADLPTR